MRPINNVGLKTQEEELVFFNGRNGWLLRRVERRNKIIRTESRYCALRSANNGSDVLRSRVSSECNKYLVHLWTVPREEENRLSCMEYWHSVDVLEERVYYCAPERKKRKHRLEEEEEEEEEIQQQSSNPTTPDRQFNLTSRLRSGYFAVRKKR